MQLLYGRISLIPLCTNLDKKIKRMQFISILIIVFLIKRYVCIDIEEIFGIGEPLSNNVNMVCAKSFLKRRGDISFWEIIFISFQENTFWKDPSYSTEDLLLP